MAQVAMKCIGKKDWLYGAIGIKPDELEIAKGMLEFLLKNELVKKTKLKKIVMFYLKKKFFICSD